MRAFGSPPPHVKAIRDYVLANGYETTIHAGGTITLRTINIPAKLAGLDSPNQSLEVNVTLDSSPDKAPPLMLLQVVNGAKPLDRIINDDNVLQYWDDYIGYASHRSEIMFIDGPAPLNSGNTSLMDGNPDKVSEGGEEVAMTQQRKNYFHRLVLNVYKLTQQK